MQLPGYNPNGPRIKVEPTERVPVTKDDIVEAALKVCTREELRSMSKPTLLSLGTLLGRRLEKLPPPTVDELIGIKELVTEHLWHPALGRLESGTGR